MSKLYGNRWKLVGKPSLGQGGQSEVFRAIDTQVADSVECALKRVLNPARHDRFRKEVEAIKQLDHPNIITLIDHSALDAGAGAEKQFIVMPLAEGGDLGRGDRLSLYRGSIDAVLQVATQIADGLKAAHAAGIIHRDVKPGNILFQPR
jgi:serine/threonine protein kinase